MVNYDFLLEDKAMFDAKKAQYILSWQVMWDACQGVPPPLHLNTAARTGMTATAHHSSTPNWPHNELATPVHMDMGQAGHHIQHLLVQINTNPALTSVRKLQVLASSWRNLPSTSLTQWHIHPWQ